MEQIEVPEVPETEPCDETQVLPVLYIRAKNNFDLGKSIGATFKGWINKYMSTSKDVYCLRRFFLSKNGRKQYEEYLEACEKCHPTIIEEIRGMAEGAEQTFEDMFLLQLSSEVVFCHAEEFIPADTEFDPKMMSTVTFKGCTDILLNTDKLRMIGHNEDWEDDVEPYVHMVHCTVTGETEEDEQEHFVSYMFPGFLPGLTFAVTRKLVITINSLRPRRVQPGAAPIAVLLRACLKCETIEEVKDTMLNTPIGCAFGMNLNIAEIGSTRMCSLEVYPGTNGTVVDLHEVPYGEQGPDTWYHHQNHYRHISGADQRGWSESIFREERLDEIGAPKTQTDIEDMLGDQENKIEPVFKDCNKEDRANQMVTMATALINLSERRIDVYRTNPKTTPQPCASIPFI